MARRTSLERHGGKGTAIARVRGLGAAGEGTGAWISQRYTAIGNLILVGFFAISLILLPDLGYGTVREWIAQPIPAVVLALMMVNTFWHARHGLQIMIEDYVDEPGNKFAVTAVLNVAFAGGAAFGLFSILRMALGGGAA
jgi:succinate dehydrogenase / fumarate reductase membrane anchor subunit